MTKSISMLGAFKVSFGGVEKFVLADFGTGSVYELSEIKRLPEDQADKFFSEFQEEQYSSAPQVPYEKIREVMGVERKLAAENEKHVFRRL